MCDFYLYKLAKRNFFLANYEKIANLTIINRPFAK